ncbi:MAG: hypothetical protein K8U57_03520 [Planctomycetes bacterium]|nr:hypothetical protein [Planctomycetota bacterium]
MSLTMAEPKKPKTNKGDRNASRHVQPRKSFHASQELFDALQTYQDSLKPTPNDSECLRTALEEFLEKRGFWPPKGSK